MQFSLFRTLFRTLSAALLAAAFGFLATSCEAPVAAKDNSQTAAATDPSKVGFEGTLTLADYTFSDGDHATGETEGMVFTADKAAFKTGAQSLKAEGTSRQNKWVLPTLNFHTEVILPLAAVTDFTGKTITAQVYLPAGSSVKGVNLTLLNAAGKAWLVAAEAAVTAGQWNAVSFDASATPGYNDTEMANVSSVAKLRLRFLTGTASAPVSVNVDSINW